MNISETIKLEDLQNKVNQGFVQIALKEEGDGWELKLCYFFLDEKVTKNQDKNMLHPALAV